MCPSPPDSATARQAVVADLGRLALEDPPLATLYDAATRAVAASLECPYAAILALDENDGLLTCRANVGWRPEAIRPVELRRDSQVGRTFLDADPIVVASYAEDARFAGARHLLEAGIVSGATVPLRDEADPLGVLAAHSDRPGAFTGEDVFFLRSVANILAASAARSDLRQQRWESRQRLERLQAVTAALAGAVTEQDVVEVILGEGVAASGAWAGLIGLVDGEDVVVRALVGYDAELIGRWQRFPVAAPLPLSDVVRTGDAYFCRSRAERNERWPAMLGENERGNAFVALPLTGRGAPLGGLALGFDGDRSFSDDDRELLVTIARQCGQALERAQADEARRLANERLAFLAEASRILGSSLDHERALDELTRAAVPRFADEVTVTLREGVADRPLLLDAETTMIVPLRTASQTLGAITFAFRDASRRYTADEVTFAEDLAARAATAIENSLLLRAEQQRANAAFVLDRVEDGVFELSPDGVVRLWNRAAARMTGIAADEALGRHAGELLGGWEAVEEELEPSSIPGSRRAPLTLPLELAGAERWVSITGVAHGDGLVYAFHDVTETRALEQARSDFLATASHELRTPLAAVYGSAQTLARRDLDDERKQKLVRMIVRESERLARIVDDILLSNSLDLGTTSVEIETVRVGAIVDELVEERTATLPAAVDLVADLDGAANVGVLADPGRLRQVLSNLVDNAIKYSPEGGKVVVGARVGEGRVVFSVADEGIGIPQSEQERVFEKFYRLDPQLTRGVGGTGLGLYICRELVQRMQGRISVSSREGAGSTFTVELPAAA